MDHMSEVKTIRMVDHCTERFSIDRASELLAINVYCEVSDTQSAGLRLKASEEV